MKFENILHVQDVEVPGLLHKTTTRLHVKILPSQRRFHFFTLSFRLSHFPRLPRFEMPSVLTKPWFASRIAVELFHQGQNWSSSSRISRENGERFFITGKLRRKQPAVGEKTSETSDSPVLILDHANPIKIFVSAIILLDVTPVWLFYGSLKVAFLEKIRGISDKEEWNSAPIYKSGSWGKIFGIEILFDKLIFQN